MRKRGYLIASLAMLLLLVLSGCKGNKLPDGMDEDKVSSAFDPEVNLIGLDVRGK
mgnify:CR=1 FL=1